MARRNIFAINFDVFEVEHLANNLAGLTAESIGAMTVQAINDTVDDAYELGRKTMLNGINLTDAYIQRKMKVDHATAKTPTASITAFGGKGFVTGLSHYDAVQLTTDVTWSNARIQAMGKKFGSWPKWAKLHGTPSPGVSKEWSRRTGSPVRGIAVDKKADGRSVEVVKGSRKRMGPAFSIPGAKDGDGGLVVFSRLADGKVVARTGPSAYQLFRVAAGLIEDEVAADLQAAVANAAESGMLKALT